jgi:hypothetical protein
VFIQLLHEVGIIHADSGELLTLLLVFSFQSSSDTLWADCQLTQDAFGQVLFELAIGNGFHFCRKKVLLHVGKQKQGEQEIPDTEMSLRRQGILFFLGVLRTEEERKLV